jgi:hypothetical protein
MYTADFDKTIMIQNKSEYFFYFENILILTLLTIYYLNHNLNSIIDIGGYGRVEKTENNLIVDHSLISWLHSFLKSHLFLSITFMIKVKNVDKCCSDLSQRKNLIEAL